MKDTLDRKNSTLSDTEDCISDMEDRIMETTQSGQQNKKKKKILKNESNLRDLRNNIKLFKIHILRMPEEERDGQQISRGNKTEHFPDEEDSWHPDSWSTEGLKQHKLQQ